MLKYCIAHIGCWWWVDWWLQLYKTEGALLLLELRQMQVSIWLSQKEKEKKSTNKVDFKPAWVTWNSLFFFSPLNLHDAYNFFCTFVNLKLVCTTGYLTGTTDIESVLQRNSMELTNKTASSKIFNHLFCTQNVFLSPLSLHFMGFSFMRQNGC